MKVAVKQTDQIHKQLHETETRIIFVKQISTQDAAKNDQKSNNIEEK